MMTFGNTKPPRPVGEVTLRTAEYTVYDDGSWRRKHPKVKGKANVKRAKRQRRLNRGHEAARQAA